MAPSGARDRPTGLGVGDIFVATADWASAIFYVAAAFGCLYALFAAWAARAFVRTPMAPPKSHPPMTILKPLYGAEPDLYANLAGFCAQSYPGPVQVVFGVSDPGDPAIAVVRKLIADFPDRDLALVINSRHNGANRKVSNLINMLPEARHEILVISDSDIVVEPDYLEHVAASLEQPGVGLVTFLYRGVTATSGSATSPLWTHLAAAAIDYHFLPSVLVGLKLGLAEPCFGSTIALRRRTLAAIGGFEAIVEQLADDYALGALVRRAGLAVAIPPCTVAHECTQRSADELFRHELRWARTIRFVDPIGFAGSAVTHALPLALLGLLLGGLTPAGLMVIAALSCRFALQRQVDRAFSLRDSLFWMGPIRDILSFAVFVASFFGRRVEWRGHRYNVQADNTLAYAGEVEP
jgi:ceramide glucosyltransferase